MSCPTPWSSLPDVPSRPTRGAAGPALTAAVALLSLLACDDGPPTGPANRLPTAPSFSVEVAKDQARTVTLEATDPDGDPLTFGVHAAPDHGDIELTKAGVMTYTPDPGYVGADGVIYSVTDGSAMALGVVDLLVAERTPVTSATASVVRRSAAGEPVVVRLEATDPDGDAVTFEVVTPPEHGTLSDVVIVSGSPAASAGEEGGAARADVPAGAGSSSTTVGEVTYTPGDGHTGPDQFGFVARDDLTTSDETMVTIEPNGVPEAAPASASTVQDTPVEIELAGDDPDGDPLTFEIVEEPSHGTLGVVGATGPATGTVTYTPQDGYKGSDTFGYRVRDGLDPSGPAEVTVLVENRRPSALDGTVEVDLGAPHAVQLRGSDPDGDALTFVVVEAPAHGSLGEVDPQGPSTARVIYTPGADFVGEDRIRFVAHDGENDSEPATIDLRVVNDPPTADDAEGRTYRNAPVTLTLEGRDPEDRPIEFEIETSPDHGTLGAITAVGPRSAEVTYTPDDGFVGADAFTFVASDGIDASAEATASVTVENRPPVADAPAPAEVAGSGSVTLALTGSDPDGDPLTFDVSSPPSSGSVVSVTSTSPTSADLVYEAGTEAGTVTFEVTASDGLATSAPAEAEVRVDGRPTADDASVTTDEDVAVEVTLEGSDPEATDLAFEILTPPEHGGLGALAHGTSDPVASASVTYTPEADYNGADGFTFRVTDGFGLTAEGSVSITVDPVNDAPEPVDAPVESFITAGNTTLQVAASKSVVPAVFVEGDLVSNFTDVDGEGDVLEASLVPSSVTTGAAVTVNADGTFTYTPPVGRTDDDTFDYTVTDGEYTLTGTVTVSTQDMVWYFHPDGTGDGRSTDPLGAGEHYLLEATEEVAGEGDAMFIHAGAYESSAELKARQRLIGEAAGLELDGLGEIVPPGERPIVMPGFTYAVELDDDNVVRGLELVFGNAAFPLAAIYGRDGSGGTIDDMIVRGHVDDNENIHTMLLRDWSGTVTITNTTVTSGPLEIRGGDPVVSFEGTMIVNDGSTLLAVEETTGGSVTLRPSPVGEITADLAGNDWHVAIRLEDVRGDVTVEGARIAGVGDPPALWLDNVDGTVTFTDLELSTSIDEAIALGGGSEGTVNIDLASSGLVHSTTSARAIDIKDFHGTATFTGGPIQVRDGGGGIVLGDNPGATIDFRSALDLHAGSHTALDLGTGADVTVGDVTVRSASTGIDLGGATGTFTATGPVAISGTSGPGIHFARGGPTTVFEGDVTVTGAGAAGIDVDGEEGADPASVTFLGHTTVDGAAGPALDIDDTEGDFTFGDVTVTDRARDRIAIDIDGAGGDLTFGALTIEGTDPWAARAVAVDGTTGGTVTFDGDHDIQGVTRPADGLLEFARTAANVGAIEWTGGTVVQEWEGAVVLSAHDAKVRMRDVTLVDEEYEGAMVGIEGGGEWDLSGLTIQDQHNDGAFRIIATSPLVLRLADSFIETSSEAVRLDTDGGTLDAVLAGVVFGSSAYNPVVRVGDGFSDPIEDDVCLSMTDVTAPDESGAEYVLSAGVDPDSELPSPTDAVFELWVGDGVVGDIDRNDDLSGHHIVDLESDTCARPTF